MGKVKDYYWEEIQNMEHVDTALESEYAKKLGLVMESYIKGDIDAIEYQIELDVLETWYRDESKKQK